MCIRRLPDEGFGFGGHEPDSERRSLPSNDHFNEGSFLVGAGYRNRVSTSLTHERRDIFPAGRLAFPPPWGAHPPL